MNPDGAILTGAVILAIPTSDSSCYSNNISLRPFSVQA